MYKIFNHARYGTVTLRTVVPSEEELRRSQPPEPFSSFYDTRRCNLG